MRSQFCKIEITVSELHQMLGVSDDDRSLPCSPARGDRLPRPTAFPSRASLRRTFTFFPIEAGFWLLQGLEPRAIGVGVASIPHQSAVSFPHPNLMRLYSKLGIKSQVLAY
jgi:hypothetical protein